MTDNLQTPFLTAHWRHLVFMNYEVDPAILSDHIPAGTELDLFHGKCLVSLVGFMFDQTKMLGMVPIPLHLSFEEVNLRFYIKRNVEGQTRRAVAFIKELVPSRSVTWVARTVYGENYEFTPMQHAISWHDDSNFELGGRFCYRWKQTGKWAVLEANTIEDIQELSTGSMEEFITEHYWGYSERKNGTTWEYQVEHPSWRTWQVDSWNFEADVKKLYGPEFAEYLAGKPHSSLVAEGSPVVLHFGEAIRGTNTD